jgi:hypothetical protein
MASTDCAVCCEEFNTTTNIKISCEHSGVCSFDACKTCVKTYLLGTTTDPNCMTCNKAWSDKLIAKNLGSTFLRSEYSIHRKELLVQQQISRMPETMAAAESHKQVLLLEEQIKQLLLEKKQSRKVYNEVHMSRDKKRSEVVKLLAEATPEEYTSLQPVWFKEIEEYNKELKAIDDTTSLIQANIRKITYDIRVIKAGGTLVGEEKKEARKFIMPCPNDDCRGYLSSQYKCDLCEHHTCSKCFELIGLSKEESGHECKPENIESAEFIKKQSKPCPCCGTRISKIDGCDQMWCTQCHKAFSWNTGKVITGTIHNPHFYQFQRENGGGTMVRNPGDVVCGGLPESRDINSKLTRSKIPLDKTKLITTVSNIHRLQHHFTAFTVTPLRTNVREEQNFEKERIQYILKEINREELGTKVIRKDNARRKQTALLHICELFTTVAIDMFQKILLSENVGMAFAEELEQRVDEYDNLRQYCNEHFKEISILYGVCVPIISDVWTSDTCKFNSKGDVDKYIEKRDAQRKVRKELEDKRRELLRIQQEERIAEYRRRQQVAREEEHQRILTADTKV